VEFNERLINACVDYKYLLSRGYGREGALRIVGDKYLLSKVERLVLYRTIFSPFEIEERRSKSVRSASLEGNTLAIDGFNVLTTVEVALREEDLFLCEDGFLRDLTSAYRKVKINEYTFMAVEKLLNALKELKVRDALIVLDSQVSHSGELCSYINSAMGSEGVKGIAYTSKNADSELISLGGIVASSDSYVISKARSVFDLAGYIIREKFKDRRVIDVAKIVREGLRKCLEGFLRGNLEG